MDDELKAIQAAFDSGLDRLAEYMNRDNSAAGEDGDETPKGREAAARVVLHYARERGTLGLSVRVAREVSRGFWQVRNIAPDSRLGEPADPDTPDKLAKLMDAMRELFLWQFHRYPLEDKHLAALAYAIDVWSNRECQFIGENVGLTLTPKRQVDPRKAARGMAALDAFELHRSDPKAYPIGVDLFERVGRHYSLSEGATRRAFYSKRMKAFRARIAYIDSQFR